MSLLCFSFPMGLAVRNCHLEKPLLTFSHVRLGSWQMSELHCDIWARAPRLSHCSLPFPVLRYCSCLEQLKRCRLYPILNVPRFNLLYSRCEFTLFSSFLTCRMNRIHPEVSQSSGNLSLQVDKKNNFQWTWKESEFLHRMNFTIDPLPCSPKQGMEALYNALCGG